MRCCMLFVNNKIEAKLSNSNILKNTFFLTCLNFPVSQVQVFKISALNFCESEPF